MNYDYIEYLVNKIKSGDEKAKEKLASEFKPLIMNIARKTFIYGYEIQDIENECYKTLFKCVNMYNENTHRFVGYATNGIKNSINDLIKKNLNKKAIYGSSTLVLDENLENYLSTDYNNLDEIFCLKHEASALSYAINKLTTDEKELIYHIYFKRTSLKNYGKLKNISYNKAIYKKNNILDKLFMFINTYNNTSVKA